MFRKWKDKRIKKKLINTIMNEILNLETSKIHPRLFYYKEKVKIYRNALNVLIDDGCNWWDLLDWSKDRYKDQLEVIIEEGLTDVNLGRLDAYIQVRCWVEKYI